MQDAVLGELTDPSPLFLAVPRRADIRAWRATIVERL
jgi:hypothetical protein